MHPTQGGPGGIPTGVIRATPALLAAGATLVAVAVVLRRLGPVRVQVEGLSMDPMLQPGDRLLLRRPRRILPGDIVALPDPRQPSRTLVKRVHSLSPAGLDLRGDNPAASTDSRTFGLLPLGAVTGVAVWRYHPPGRTGPIGRSHRSPGRP